MSCWTARMLVVAGLTLGGAIAPETPVRGADAGDVQDLLFLGGKETVLVRLHIRIDDRPLNTAWHNAVAALHQYLDYNGAGTVARDEELPDLVPILRAPLGVQPRLAGGSPRDAAFARIDSDRDGTLGRDEREQAGRVLLRFDRNDDETISGAELQPARDPATRPAEGDPGKTAALVLLLEKSESRIRAVQQVLTRFDTGGAAARAKDHRLGRSEIRLPADTFQRYDSNRDGALDSVELMEFLDDSDPTVELIVRLGSRPAGRPPLELIDARDRQPAAQQTQRTKLRRCEARALLLDLGDFWVDIRFEDAMWDRARTRKAFETTFQDLDLDDSKSLTSTEARGSEPFGRLFRLMDRNVDGRVVPEETHAALALIEDLWRGHAQLTVVDRGVQLFGNLDSNGDGRLGLRELHDAGIQLAAFDSNGDGKLAAGEVPHRFEWSFSQVPLPLGVLGGTSQEMHPTAGGGPHWFQEMDRNRDGDISPREFIGRPDAFSDLDINRDGLINAQEAAAATPRSRSG